MFIHSNGINNLDKNVLRSIPVNSLVKWHSFCVSKTSKIHADQAHIRINMLNIRYENVQRKEYVLTNFAETSRFQIFKMYSKCRLVKQCL